MEKLSNEKLDLLRRSVAHYLDLLEDDNNKDENEYKLLEELYNELVDLSL